jgi:membrane fusion protein, copper/silver efflux system
MRRTGIVIVLLSALAVSYGMVRAHQRERSVKSGTAVLYYVDPMHPSYHSDKPGIAPDCGMPLEPVYAETTKRAAGSDSGQVRIDPAVQQLAGIRTVAVEKSGGLRRIRTVGRVNAEDTRMFTLNTGVDGFIRGTQDDSVGTVVNKDQILGTYYAPDFIAAASGFLAANERIPGSVTSEGARSIQNYTDRLRTLGMSDLQIQHLAATKQLPTSIEIVSPVRGVIIARNITKGQHFEHNMEFYRIADLSRVWVIAELSEGDAAALQHGARAQISIRNENKRFSGRVANSLAQADARGGTIKVRVEAENPGFTLRPDMLVDVDFSAPLPVAVSVPADALIETGSGARVYVAEGDNQFEARKVTTGWRSADKVQIVEGVRPGDRVVA